MVNDRRTTAKERNSSDGRSSDFWQTIERPLDFIRRAERNRITSLNNHFVGELNGDMDKIIKTSREKGEKN